MTPKNAIQAGWFYVAVQALVVIARADEPCPSATIACAVSAHAVFLRRILAQLVRAGLVEAREGRAGGYRLSRDAAAITLGSVYEAVRAAGQTDDPLPSYVTQGVESVLNEIGVEVESGILEVLASHTLASVIDRAGAAAAGRGTTGFRPSGIPGLLR